MFRLVRKQKKNIKLNTFEMRNAALHRTLKNKKNATLTNVLLKKNKKKKNF
jgi:hypothetical protein